MHLRLREESALLVKLGAKPQYILLWEEKLCGCRQCLELGKIDGCWVNLFLSQLNENFFTKDSFKHFLKQRD